jgi:hypothetical protein
VYDHVPGLGSGNPRLCIERRCLMHSLVTRSRSTVVDHYAKGAEDWCNNRLVTSGERARGATTPTASKSPWGLPRYWFETRRIPTVRLSRFLRRRGPIFLTTSRVVPFEEPRLNPHRADPVGEVRAPTRPEAVAGRPVRVSTRNWAFGRLRVVWR